MIKNTSEINPQKPHHATMVKNAEDKIINLSNLSPKKTIALALPIGGLAILLLSSLETKFQPQKKLDETLNPLYLDPKDFELVNPIPTNVSYQPESSENALDLSINVSRILTSHQRKFFKYGFSVYSEIKIEHPSFSQKHSCIIKKNGWDDRYIISDIKTSKVYNLRNLSGAFKTCFQFQVSKTFISQSSGKLKITIRLDPISYETAEDMKEWLKNAQPGPFKPLIKLFFEDSLISYSSSKSIDLKRLNVIYDKLAEDRKNKAQGSLTEGIHPTKNSEKNNEK